ncbi:hypothetical protein B7995_07785 [Staphylococcus aureus]|nr:hypothetical protein B8A14_04205 [Staphylococcus aureus]ORN82573.1 hypothetical protein B7986_11430 [Staphylococcus aureus]ORN82771.1 hypothetical protein B8A15_05240 [Staphylococcus aureus]ORN87699.1 hypothetical protein B8A13_02470 [Staphylococcus aureus]ORO23322.1 hypothetical protein B7999_03940 [Staphylococcus aureus]
MLVGGPNIEAYGNSAYNNVQVGVGSNTENFEKKFHKQYELAHYHSVINIGGHCYANRTY